MLDQLIWRGRTTAALVYGVMFGAGVTVFRLLEGESVAEAITGGLLTGLIAGPLVAWLTWGNWPSVGDLSSADRLTVVRSVREGRAVPDARLRPAVLYYAAGVIEADERARWGRWGCWGLAAVVVLLALTGWADDSVRTGALWVSTVVLVGAAVLQPRWARRARSRAEQAVAASQAG